MIDLIERIPPWVWITLVVHGVTLGTVAYLISLPFGWVAYREHERKDAAAVLQASSRSAARATAESESPSLSPTHPEHPPRPERPARLN